MNRLKQAKTSHRRSALSIALYSAGIFGALAAVPNAYAVPAVGLALSGTQIVTFDTATPGTISAPITLTGFTVGAELLVSIDRRPADGLLYGFTQFGNIYTINTATGALTLARAAATDFIDDAGFYGFDFNPVVDRLRLTNDLATNSNRRINVGDASAAGLLVDGELAYAPAPDPNAGANPAIEASAYTNNFGPAAPTTTVLYGIDTTLDILVRQDPPNTGTLNTVGSLGQNFSSNLTSFDIFGDTQAFAVSGDQFAAPTPATLYTVNLTTGAAASAGLIGPAGGTLRVVSIAVGIQGPPPPAPAGAIQFSPTTLTVAEDVGNAVLTVTRPAGSTGVATVIATPTNGTGAAGAVAPGDFTAAPITVTFGAAELSRPVPVPIINDTAQEGAETFTVVLSAPTGGATLGAASTATVTISANDSAAPPPPAPAPAPTDDDDGGCTVNPNGRDAGLLMLLLGGALAALRRRMKR